MISRQGGGLGDKIFTVNIKNYNYKKIYTFISSLWITTFTSITTFIISTKQTKPTKEKQHLHNTFIYHLHINKNNIKQKYFNSSFSFLNSNHGKEECSALTMHTRTTTVISHTDNPI